MKNKILLALFHALSIFAFSVPLASFAEGNSVRKFKITLDSSTGMMEGAEVGQNPCHPDVLFVPTEFSTGTKPRVFPHWAPANSITLEGLMGLIAEEIIPGAGNKASELWTVGSVMTEFVGVQVNLSQAQSYAFAANSGVYFSPICKEYIDNSRFYGQYSDDWKLKHETMIEFESQIWDHLYNMHEPFVTVEVENGQIKLPFPAIHRRE